MISLSSIKSSSSSSLVSSSSSCSLLSRFTKTSANATCSTYLPLLTINNTTSSSINNYNNDIGKSLFSTYSLTSPSSVVSSSSSSLPSLARADRSRMSSRKYGAKIINKKENSIDKDELKALVSLNTENADLLWSKLVVTNSASEFTSAVSSPLKRARNYLIAYSCSASRPPRGSLAHSLSLMAAEKDALLTSSTVAGITPSSSTTLSPTTAFKLLPSPGALQLGRHAVQTHLTRFLRLNNGKIDTVNRLVLQRAKAAAQSAQPAQPFTRSSKLSVKGMERLNSYYAENLIDSVIAKPGYTKTTNITPTHFPSTHASLSFQSNFSLTSTKRRSFHSGSFQQQQPQQPQQQLQQQTPPPPRKRLAWIHTNQSGSTESFLTKPYFRIYVVLGIAFVVYAATHIEQVPFSGRFRVLLMPIWLEQYIAEMFDEQLIAESKDAWLPEHVPDFRVIKAVGERICKANGIPPLTYHLIDSPVPNAMVSMNGTVFVNTGILPIMKNEDGVAVVLSHEIGHYIAHHNSEALIFNVILLLTRLIWDIESPGINWIFNMVGTLPMSRNREREADLIGLMLMARSCFNIDEAKHVWERFQGSEEKHDGLDVQKYFSTHPPNSERAENFESSGEWMKRARIEQEKACIQGISMEQSVREEAAKSTPVQPMSALAKILQKHRERKEK